MHLDLLGAFVINNGKRVLTIYKLSSKYTDIAVFRSNTNPPMVIVWVIGSALSAQMDATFLTTADKN